LDLGLLGTKEEPAPGRNPDVRGSWEEPPVLVFDRARSRGHMSAGAESTLSREKGIA